MKVKFYKGPWHGKVREVQDNQEIVFVIGNTPVGVYRDDYYPVQEIALTKHVYRRTRHTHPDGSTFFVYGGKS